MRQDQTGQLLPLHDCAVWPTMYVYCSQTFEGMSLPGMRKWGWAGYTTSGEDPIGAGRHEFVPLGSICTQPDC